MKRKTRQKRNFNRSYSQLIKVENSPFNTGTQLKLIPVLGMKVKQEKSSTHYRPAMPFGKRKQYFKDFFSSVLSQFKKKYHPSGNLKFNNLGIFQSLILRFYRKNPSNFS